MIKEFGFTAVDNDAVSIEPMEFAGKKLSATGYGSLYRLNKYTYKHNCRHILPKDFASAIRRSKSWAVPVKLRLYEE